MSTPSENPLAAASCSAFMARRVYLRWSPWVIGAALLPAARIRPLFRAGCHSFRSLRPVRAAAVADGRLGRLSRYSGRAGGHLSSCRYDAGGRDAVPGDDRPVEIGRAAMHENGHGIFDGEYCRPVPPAPRGHAAAGQQEPAAASLLVVRPVCGPGSLPARMHENGSDPPQRRRGRLTRCLTPWLTPPPSPNRASGQKGGVAPVLSLAADAVRVVRSRTTNPNSDSEKWKRGA